MTTESATNQQQDRNTGPYAVEQGYRLTVVLDPDGRVRTATEVSGMVTPPAEFFVGKTMAEIAGARAGAERGAMWAERIACAQHATEAMHYVDSAPGAPVTDPPSVECTLTPIRATDGELQAILLDLRDHTAEFFTRSKLFASERRFRELAEALPQIVWETDAAGNVVYFSPRWTEFTGRTEARLLGREFLDLIHPNDRAIFVTTPGQDEPPGPVQFRMLRHDGVYRWMESHVQVIHDGEGNVLRSVGTTLDITDRLAAEQAAREYQEQLLGALEVTGLGRYAIYLRERRMTADARVWEILGVDPETAQHESALTTLAGLIDPDDLALASAAVAAAAQGGPDVEVTQRLRRPTSDGPEQRWITLHGRVEHDLAGPYRLVGVLEDVTERRLEAQTRELMQKRDMIGTLAGGVAHDFNNLLSAIGNNTTLAQHELAAGQSPATSLEEIAQATKRAAELVQRMLLHSREDAPQRLPVDLGAIAREACSLLGPSVPKTAVLEVNAEEPLEPITGDATQLHQVVMNLVVNAGQALGSTPGTISVGVQTTAASPEAGLATPQCVRLTVRDDGPGMPESVRRRAFNPFFTTKPAGEGTGLGLAAAHSIVRDHGGAIGVESVPGSHTLFWAEFPVATPD